jgi:Zn-dependent metalloprotease
LKYEGESGALNEHISDVFGKMATLWAEKKTSADSDWLIGEGCLMPGIKGVALRNMKFPGTAYDDPQVRNHETGRLSSTALPLQNSAPFNHN